MKKLCWAALVLVVALAAATLAPAANAGTPSASETPKATDIGVTPKEIRIAIVADVDNPFAPGLFQGSVDAVNGAVKLINAQGGIGGRKVTVDFIDSHLNPNASRNAIITACSQDFALVGTSALFLTNVDDEVSCKNAQGQAIGLPDIGGIVTGIPQQCAPTSFPVPPPQIDCSTKDKPQQTYQGTQGDSKYFLRTINKDLHGPFVLPNDTPDAYRGDAVQMYIAVQAGIKSDQAPTRSGRDPQSAYTAIVQKMKQDKSNYAFDGLAYPQVIEFRQEAALQGINTNDVTWVCTTACYDPKYLKDGGAAAEGTHMWMAFLPFNETGSNKALANYVKYVGPTKTTGLGLYAYVAGMAFQQVLKDVVAKQGVNAITRQNLLNGLKQLTNFNAGGMIGNVNVAQRITSPCFVEIEVQNGKFVRILPKKKGTFDCKKSNHATVQEDLLKK